MFTQRPIVPINRTGEPLLPGFGPDIGTLFERDYTDWVAAIEAKLTDVRDGYTKNIAFWLGRQTETYGGVGMRLT